MGEKKFKSWVTVKDLSEALGLSMDYFYKNASVFEPALLVIGGKAPRPHKYDAEIIEQILSKNTGTTRPESAKAKKQLQRRAKIRRLQKESGNDDELFD